MGRLFSSKFFHVAGNCLVKNSRYSSSQFRAPVSAGCCGSLGLSPEDTAPQFPNLFPHTHLLGGLCDIHQHKNATKEPKVDPVNINSVLSALLFPVSPRWAPAQTPPPPPTVPSDPSGERQSPFAPWQAQ